MQYQFKEITFPPRVTNIQHKYADYFLGQIFPEEFWGAGSSLVVNIVDLSTAGIFGIYQLMKVICSASLYVRELFLCEVFEDYFQQISVEYFRVKI